MSELYVVSFTTKSNNFIFSEASTKIFKNEKDVITFAQGFVDDFRKMICIFSVDALGKEITHHEIVWDGRLILIEKNQ